MPRKINPGSIRTGSGSTPSTAPNLDLTGPGMVGPGPNIGDVQGSLVDTIVSPAPLPANMVTTDASPILNGHTAQGALDELIGAVPQAPPSVGNWTIQQSVNGAQDTWIFSGIPDWGILKLADQSLVDKGLVVASDKYDVFPYYHEPPSPALNPLEFAVSPGLGGDPESDNRFNSQVPAGAALEGSGAGQAYAGAFTRVPGFGLAGDVIRTARIIKRTSVIDGGTGLPERQAVTVSGYVYPADRGVLALIHWPAGGTTTEFLAQALLDRCVGAILLGQGLSGAVPGACDGGAGGIFGTGAFDFPGLATGQYDLEEINTGVASIGGLALKPPFDDLDADAVAGAKRFQNTTVPGPAQVRLGTDPAAGEAALPYGIPVLGATGSMYSPVVAGELGSTSVVSSNFFRYRVPFMGDYTPETGLKYTPRGLDAVTTQETARYFETATPEQSWPATPVLATAGVLTAFERDYWPWQVARFRHSFLLPSTQAAGDPEDCGSYLLIHFRNEGDFESFVRDGIMPDDPTNGYALYSSEITSTGTTIEGVQNVVNEKTAADFAPAGPAPEFGYTAKGYHTARVSVFLDPDADGVDFSGVTGTYSWATDSTPAGEVLTYVSGIAYMVPFSNSGSASAFRFTDLSFSIGAGSPGFWQSSYRVNATTLTAGADPALLSSPNPAFVGLRPYGVDVTSYTVPVGAPLAALTESTDFKFGGRFEVPYTHCGSNGFGAFGAANGPQSTDDLEIQMYGGPMDFIGDLTTSAFTQDAKVRAYVRKPGGHDDPTTTILPYSANDGQGFDLTPNPAATILFHSSKYSFASADWPRYGNFKVSSGVNTPISSYQAYSAKRRQEAFLDETFRWLSAWHVDVGAGLQAYLVGPGMAGWVGGAVDVPLCAGAANAPWDTSSYVMSNTHTSSLHDGIIFDELQVAGLPDRNPVLTAGCRVPFPSVGLLQYPQTDYSAGYKPDATEIHRAQYDYSACTGVRSFVRTLDASYGLTENVIGQPYFHLRIDGLSLADFAYSGAGPGGLTSASGIAILVKIPGLTTWMDIGRVDGAGPSKQDPTLDGAGCQMVGATTFEGVDADTKIPYVQVGINAGPIANLFRSDVSHTYDNNVIATEIMHYAPVLVKVVMDVAAVGYNLKEEYVSPGVFGGVAKPGLPWTDVRGLTGIRIVRASEV